MPTKELKWHVFKFDFNKREIVPFNIFDHVSFANGIDNTLTKTDGKDKFAEDLERQLLYYYKHRGEYEVLIGPWISEQHTKSIKVDIYTQVMNNWDVFLDYVWTNW